MAVRAVIRNNEKWGLSEKKHRGTEVTTDAQLEEKKRQLKYVS